jgi:cytochrome d ubiquinol oxidase subunit II
MSPELIAAGALLVALNAYALFGGADYGGGLWDLLATGHRAHHQRTLIAHAIGPVWEANHVWLILAVVLLFTAFPPAFAAIAIALHIPLTVMLVGIVLRGTAFTFRTYDSQHSQVQRRWSRIFSVASIVTPIMLGITVGAIASGRLEFRDGVPVVGFVATWLAPFPLAVGGFTLVLFAFLAAVYLTVEAGDSELQDAFRLRAIAAGVVTGIMAAVVLLLSSEGAPSVHAGLQTSNFAVPLHLATAIFAVAAFGTLWLRKFRWARFFAAGQVTLILWGWALAQYPYVVEPDLTITSAAAPPVTLRLLLIALCAGAVILIPSLYYLFRVFKRPN